MTRNRSEPPPSIVAITTVDLATNNGPALHFINLINGLSTLRHNLTAVYPSIAEQPVVSISDAITCRPVTNMRRAGLPRTLSAIPAGLAVPAPEGPTVAYIRASPMTVLLHMTARLSRFSAVIVEYNGWIAEEAEKLGYPKHVCSFIDTLQRMEASRADRIRVVTDGLKDILVAQGIPSERISVIGNGTDTSIFSPRDKATARASLGLSPTGPVFAFLGNLWPVIDISTMLQAFRLVQGEYPDSRLLVVGDGPGAVVLDNAEAEGQAHGIHRFGSRPPREANEIIAAADVMLAPFTRARNERIGLSPLKIRDYAAAGRPIAATHLPGLAALADQPWVALAEPEDAAALAHAMTSHLGANIDDKGALARQFAEENFAWQVIASGVSDLIVSAVHDGTQATANGQS